MKDPSTIGMNPMAAKNPKNYTVEFGFRFIDDNSRKNMLEFLDNYCSVNKLKCVEREEPGQDKTEGIVSKKQK